MDEMRKKDLRASHFRVGGESYPMNSIQKMSYRPMSAQVARLNKDKQADLRKSHFVVGEKQTTQMGGNTPFVTNNMINFRWVQPTPKPYWQDDDNKKIDKVGIDGDNFLKDD